MCLFLFFLHLSTWIVTFKLKSMKKGKILKKLNIVKMIWTRVEVID